MSRIDRRDAIKMIGLGAVAVGTGSMWRSTAMAADVMGPGDYLTGKPLPEPVGVQGSSEQRWLMEPISAGAEVRGSRVKSMTDVVDGVITVNMERDNGHSFDIRICRRDDSEHAPRPVARSEYYDFFLPNGGKGDQITDEGEGLTVLALAAMVQGNEASHAPLALDTMRQHWCRA